MVRGGGRCKYDEDDLTDGDEEEQPYTEEYGEEEEESYTNDPGASAPAANGLGSVTVRVDTSEAVAMARTRAERPIIVKGGATAAAKRSAAAAEARTALKRRGVLTAETIADHVVIQMAQDLERNERCVESELAKVCALGLGDVVIHTEARRVEVSGDYGYFTVIATDQYPDGKDSVFVDGGDSPVQSALLRLLRASKLSEGRLVPLVKVLYWMATTASENAIGVDLARQWEAVASESIPPERLIKGSSSSSRVVEVRESEAERLQRVEKAQRAAGAADQLLNALEERKMRKRLRERAAKRSVEAKANLEPACYPNKAAQEEAMDSLVALMASDPSRTMLAYIARNSVELPPSIVSLSSLTSLDFTRCYLATLPPFGDLRLRRLYLSWNQFQVFPQTLLTASLMSSIEVLDFTHNELTMLPDELGHMTELRMMLFDHNRLEALPPMSKLVRLEVLRVEHNKIRLLPTELVHLSSLVRLSTSGNDLLNVPSGVTDGPSVKRYLRAHASGQLHVPPGNLVDDLRWLCRSAPDGGADVHLVLDAGVVPIHSAVLQGRLPRLLANNTPMMTGEQPTEEGIQHIVLKDVDLQAMRILVALAVGTFRRHRERDEEHEATVAALVHAYGSTQLIQDWAAVSNGKFVIFERSIAADLAASFAQLRSTPPAKRVGDIVALRVECMRNDDEKDTSDGVPGAAAADDTATESPSQPQEEEAVVVAHRGLLARRCPFFLRQFASGMADAPRDGDAVEVRLAVDVTFDVFESMLRYLYTDSDDVVVPDNAASLLLLASEYELPRLGNIAEMLLGKHMDEQNAAQVLQLAHLAGARALKRACVLYMSGNPTSQSTAAFSELQPALQRLFG